MKKSLHARKFANCNELEWVPTREKLVPSEEDITNENIEEFFVQCWDDGSKPYIFILQNRFQKIFQAK